ncbi:MaoC/PaaZ C-terminal domain-containing protein [Campylobacter jejuni]|uniref:MaoC/PaaZ C-terminal domain-containing protein n=1 Tax=Campylobacter jejuni TaxID=197 RepID=UPI0012746F69|nr:MaoC/PaaZ C-terminal domain-containing protein [Campylobacter jejuni]EAK2197440.1 hypothetical protein [Campylobacter jejuni]MBX0960747.1 hypothetical protein [Campylobacter jejuni]
MNSISQKKLELFSKLSGDFNPLHLDQKFAKNSYYGDQVIYGIYQVFLTLENFFKKNQKNIKIQKIKANFINPLFKNEDFKLKSIKSKNNFLKKYEIINKNKILSKIDFEFQEELKLHNPYESNLFNKYDAISNPLSKEKNAKEELKYNTILFKQLFPLCANYLNPQNIAILLASTRIVGMKIPGLHSIYSSLNLNFSNDSIENKQLIYNYEKHHSIECYLIDFISPCKGSIKAFIRPQLVKNLNYKSLVLKYPNISENKNFKEQKALVIGASSGLGNACAKILALGGAKILATYHTKNIQEDIPNCDFLQYNVLKPSKISIEKIKKFNPTHIYYFATPKISTQNNKLDRKMLFDFLDYYIFGLEKILSFTNPISSSSSSSFVEDLPLDMKEYSIAKAAMEIYMKYLKKTKNIEIKIPRFPRAKTNQTLSFIPQDLKETDELIVSMLLNKELK